MSRDWIENYSSYMSAGDYLNALELKKINLPKTFFKYRGLSDKTIHAIRENYVHLVPAQN